MYMKLLNTFQIAFAADLYIIWKHNYFFYGEAHNSFIKKKSSTSFTYFSSYVLDSLYVESCSECLKGP